VGRTDRSFLRVFTADLIALELGNFDPATREQTSAWVLERLEGASDLTRLIFTVISAGLGLAVRVRSGARYADLTDGRRWAIAERLAATRTPPIADFVRALRALAVTHAYEYQFAARP
jgi:hypothetical protein